jgi:hypothetical protein
MKKVCKCNTKEAESQVKAQPAMVVSFIVRAAITMRYNGGFA